jgi:hypothetical protein
MLARPAARGDRQRLDLDVEVAPLRSRYTCPSATRLKSQRARRRGGKSSTRLPLTRRPRPIAHGPGQESSGGPISSPIPTRASSGRPASCLQRADAIRERADAEAFKVYDVLEADNAVQEYVVFCEFGQDPALEKTNRDARRVIEAQRAKVVTDLDDAVSALSSAADGR